MKTKVKIFESVFTVKDLETRLNDFLSKLQEERKGKSIRLNIQAVIKLCMLL